MNPLPTDPQSPEEHLPRGLAYDPGRWDEARESPGEINAYSCAKADHIPTPLPHWIEPYGAKPIRYGNLKSRLTCPRHNRFPTRARRTKPIAFLQETPASRNAVF